jgi:hypothetical protein
MSFIGTIVGAYVCLYSIIAVGGERENNRPRAQSTLGHVVGGIRSAEKKDPASDDYSVHDNTKLKMAAMINLIQAAFFLSMFILDVNGEVTITARHFSLIARICLDTICVPAGLGEINWGEKCGFCASFCVLGIFSVLQPELYFQWACQHNIHELQRTVNICTRSRVARVSSRMSVTYTLLHIPLERRLLQLYIPFIINSLQFILLA